MEIAGTPAAVRSTLSRGNVFFPSWTKLAKLASLTVALNETKSQTVAVALEQMTRTKLDSTLMVWGEEGRWNTGNRRRPLWLEYMCTDLSLHTMHVTRLLPPATTAAVDRPFDQIIASSFKHFMTYFDEALLSICTTIESLSCSPFDTTTVSTASTSGTGSDT